MTEISDAFLYLERDERSRQVGLLTRPSGTAVSEGDVLLAIDGSGRRRLLIPAETDEIPEDRRSRGVALLADELVVDGETKRFAALVCLDQTLARVFERLVEDTLRRLEQGDVSPFRAAQQVLGEWRTFLSAAGREMDRSTAIGLTGELEILARLTAVADPVECWRGPLGALHDFINGPVELEVKTTTSVDGNTVRVSNLDQLDPPEEGTLFLAVVHLRASEEGPSLEDRVTQLLEAGLARDRLYDRLARNDFVPGQDQGRHRYEVRGIRLWQVDDGFPGLRRSGIEEDRLTGISRINYDLALDSAPKPIHADVADQLLRSLGHPA